MDSYRAHLLFLQELICVLEIQMQKNKYWKFHDQHSFLPRIVMYTEKMCQNEYEQLHGPQSLMLRMDVFTAKINIGSYMAHIFFCHGQSSTLKKIPNKHGHLHGPQYFLPRMVICIKSKDTKSHMGSLMAHIVLC